MKTSLIILSMIVPLFSACAAPNNSQPTETMIPTDEIVSTPEPTLPPIQVEPSPTNAPLPAMATYTDDLAGFSLDYPADWFVESSAATNTEQAFAYTVGIATWDLRNPPTPSGKNENALPDGGTKIDVTVVKQAMTLEEASTQQSESGSPVLARKDVMLTGGLPGVILDVEGFAGPIRTLITILNGNVIYVSGYGDLKNFEAIALSLRAK